MSTIAATSAIPWLPTTSALVESEISLAEQIAMMLRVERQVVVLATGRDTGRMGGFLADLTHAVSQHDSVLRIKAALNSQELFAALAGQLNLPTHDLSPMQLAAKVGERLCESAPRGGFVLLCEGAHLFSAALLESIRQLSNYPINIVLCGHRPLLRRLSRSTLNQRVNYRLELDSSPLTPPLKWFVVLAVFAGLAYAGTVWLARKPTREPGAIHRISNTLDTAPQLQPSLALLPALPTLPALINNTPETDQDVVLVFDPELQRRPSQPAKP
ncbi:MAG: ATP-binding protein [Burkholderiales bacterium]|nr:ATP-binding protein [Burkholderiales bacterium]